MEERERAKNKKLKFVANLEITIVRNFLQFPTTLNYHCLDRQHQIPFFVAKRVENKVSVTVTKNNNLTYHASL
jgi:hypothetical protein